MSATAYDTAWVARVPKPGTLDEPLFPAAYDWLLQNQHADGSWGAEIPFAHDRVISTLAALVTLARTGYRQDESGLAARRAVVYLNRERLDLHNDPAETVGFELLLPELARQAQEIGLSLPYDDWAFVEAIKADKLRRIPPIAVYGGPTPLTHSLEYLGDHLVPALIARCRSGNGSFGSSPSATAYAYTRVPNDEALQYLERTSKIHPSHGFTYLHPFENFETAWVLDALRPLIENEPLAESRLDRLERAWTAMGQAWSNECEIPDGDDTAVSLYLLSRYGRARGTEIFELFETPDYFQTFVFERNPSVTTNAHILYALRQFSGSPDRRRMIVKIVSYLNAARGGKPYWDDKWHASPFYATNRALLALSGVAGELVRPAVDWIVSQQHEDGSWGAAGGTNEETAWAVNALIAVSREDAGIVSTVRPPIESASVYLRDRMDSTDHPALWIGKGLYSAPSIVRAVILGALANADALGAGTLT